MTKLAAMAQWLKPAPASSSIVQEKRKVADLKTISTTLKDKFPSQNLPDSKVCEKIGEVFAKLSEANKAYAEAAEGLADLSTLVTPEVYTLLLTTAIQIVVPGKLITPLTTPPPPPPPNHGNIGKKVKSYATIPTLHSLGKGGKPHGKNPSPLAKQNTTLAVHIFQFPVF